MSCTTRTSTSRPRSAGPYWRRSDGILSLAAFLFSFRVPIVMLPASTSRMRRRFPLQRTGAAAARCRKPQKHPRTVVKNKFCTIGAVDGYDFSARECRSVHGHPLDRLCFLFVGKMKILAHRPEFSAEPFVHAANLLADGGSARGDHFRHPQA